MSQTLLRPNYAIDAYELIHGMVFDRFRKPIDMGEFLINPVNITDKQIVLEVGEHYRGLLGIYKITLADIMNYGVKKG